MELQHPHPRTRLAVSLYALIAALMLAVPAIALVRFAAFPRQMVGLFFALWSTVILWLLGVYLPLRYRHARFGVNDEQVTVVSGVYIRATRQMSLAGVRHVTVIRGPLERRWGYAFVVVSGAGGRLLLEGVRACEATQLCDRLTHRGRR